MRTTKNFARFGLPLLCALALGSGAFAEESPLIKQMYKGGWPNAKEVKSVHEQFLHPSKAYALALDWRAVE